MEYRKLGSSDLTVSVIGFGAWGIGGSPFWSTEGDDASLKSLTSDISYERTAYEARCIWAYTDREVMSIFAIFQHNRVDDRKPRTTDETTGVGLLHLERKWANFSAGSSRGKTLVVGRCEHNMAST